jgi:Holliday junction DNA helicase RuvA
VIGGLRGTLAALDVTGDAGVEVMVDVAGVGYDVVVGSRCAAGLPPIGCEVSLSIYTYVREGAISLFGFPDRDERRMFSLVISAHGIGPALGLAILGSLSPGELVRAVTAGDVDALTVVPGVGKKTAQRLVMELSERIGSTELPTIAMLAPRDGDGDLRDALAALGYGPDDVRSALDLIPDGGSLEERLRLVLRELAPTATAR